MTVVTEMGFALSVAFPKLMAEKTSDRVMMESADRGFAKVFFIISPSERLVKE